MKTCTKCQIEKESEDYRKNPQSRDDLLLGDAGPETLQRAADYCSRKPKVISIVQTAAPAAAQALGASPVVVKPPTIA